MVGLIDLPRDTLLEILERVSAQPRARFYGCCQYTSWIGESSKSALEHLPECILICILDQIPVPDLIHLITKSKLINLRVSTYFTSKITAYGTHIRRTRLINTSVKEWSRCETCRRQYKLSSLLLRPPLFVCFRCTKRKLPKITFLTSKELK